MFVYGELCKPAVLHAVIGRVPPSAPALLSGYERRMNPDSGFYRAAAREGGVVVGLLLSALSVAELRDLDNFENVAGDEYERVAVLVREIRGQATAEAWIYACPAASASTPRG